MRSLSQHLSQMVPDRDVDARRLTQPLSQRDSQGISHQLSQATLQRLSQHLCPQALPPRSRQPKAQAGSLPPLPPQKNKQPTGVAHQTSNPGPMCRDRGAVAASVARPVVDARCGTDIALNPTQLSPAVQPEKDLLPAGGLSSESALPPQLMLREQASASSEAVAGQVPMHGAAQAVQLLISSASAASEVDIHGRLDGRTADLPRGV